MFRISSRSSLKWMEGVEFSPSFVIWEEMISTSHLDCLEILNIFSKRKQIDFLSVVKGLQFYSGLFWDFKGKFAWIVFWWLYFSLNQQLVFSIVWKINIGDKDEDEWSQLSWRGACEGQAGVGARPHWQGWVEPKTRQPVNSLCPSCQHRMDFLTEHLGDTLLAFWGLGLEREKTTPMHSIPSGLQGFVNGLNKIWIHFLYCWQMFTNSTQKQNEYVLH